ncbi:MAG TPA: NADPH:quinone reductase [Candidatus Cybelea sp.]|nr:NADPH:quinone reductase [Candidatus Cybelea sp.]
MRAAYYEKLGPAREVLKFGDLPKPEPEPGEVLVRVHVSGVNPSDVKMRLGTSSAASDYPRIIPHSDGAGVIEAVGAGISQSRVGERVWLWNARWLRAFGTAAEYVALPEAQAVPLPSNVDFEAGACLGIPALTAWQAIETDGGVGPMPDGHQWVLVQGGAGSVGHYAVQMAKLKGARVIATVSSEEKAARAEAAGADAVLNYKTEDLAAGVKALTGGHGCDRVIEVDFAANAAKLPALLADYGLVAVYGSGAREVPVNFGSSILGNIGYRFFIVYNQPAELRRRAIAELDQWLRAGRLLHSVAARFPLRDIATAHEAVESGRMNGHVVVTID